MTVNAAGKFRRTPSEVRSPRDTRHSPIRVMIADDHTVVREGLVAMLGRQSDMAVVAEAVDGQGGLDLWKRHRPDVGLVDLRMPGLDGVSCMAGIRALDPSARLIVLTILDGDEDIYRGLRAGARAYLLKDCRPEELLECIRTVHGGQMFLPSAVAARLAGRLNEEALTRREQDVLHLLALGKTNKEIGQHLSINDTTVKSHVRGILAKLNVLNRTQAMAAASRRGLVRI